MWNYYSREVSPQTGRQVYLIERMNKFPILVSFFKQGKDCRFTACISDEVLETVVLKIIQPPAPIEI